MNNTFRIINDLTTTFGEILSAGSEVVILEKIAGTLDGVIVASATNPDQTSRTTTSNLA